MSSLSSKFYCSLFVMWTYYCIVWFDTYQHNQYKHPFTKGQALNVTCITLLGLVIIWGQRILQRGHKIFWQHVNSFSYCLFRFGESSLVLWTNLLLLHFPVFFSNPNKPELSVLIDFYYDCRKWVLS